MHETVLAEVAQRSPTSPETNLESRAMQVRVPWTQAWLCTKDFRRKCTGAGVAAKVAVPRNAAQRGPSLRTYPPTRRLAHVECERRRSSKGRRRPGSTSVSNGLARLQWWKGRKDSRIHGVV
ncbi:hypothetical protein NDU88_005382 [Pleurodeles waltl]|uniref:Uncharacterized protein n=1 Tax=Pleurodeles waltl TaxID=8319 RepID=A0AAV7NRD4_PLEWA|nr:hypothetical protein NDU88_005382 [Pleurodeles waltl]